MALWLRRFWSLLYFIVSQNICFFWVKLEKHCADCRSHVYMEIGYLSAVCKAFNDDYFNLIQSKTNKLQIENEIEVTDLSRKSRYTLCAAQFRNYLKYRKCFSKKTGLERSEKWSGRNQTLVMPYNRFCLFNLYISHFQFSNSIKSSPIAYRSDE